MKKFFKSNKNLLIGTGIGFICLSIAIIFVRINNTKITSENMSDYIKQESTIIRENSRIHENYRELIDMTIRGNILDKGDEKETIVANKFVANDVIETIDEISLDDLEKYHEFLVGYANTTEEDEYNYFLVTQAFYYETKIYASYCDKIIELYDGEFSDEDFEIIKNIDEIRLSFANREFDENSDLYKLRKEIYNSSGVDYNAYVEFQKELKKLDGKKNSKGEGYYKRRIF